LIEFAHKLDEASTDPQPEAKNDLIDRLWSWVWSEPSRDRAGFERDARWDTAICKRISGLLGGWIAVVVGWQHADPKGGNRRLSGLLSSKGFSVTPVRLGP
jgi:hypothetical protein